MIPAYWKWPWHTVTNYNENIVSPPVQEMQQDSRNKHGDLTIISIHASTEVNDYSKYEQDLLKIVCCTVVMNTNTILLVQWFIMQLFFAIPTSVAILSWLIPGQQTQWHHYWYQDIRYLSCPDKTEVSISVLICTDVTCFPAKQLTFILWSENVHCR